MDFETDPKRRHPHKNMNTSANKSSNKPIHENFDQFILRKKSLIV